MVVVTRQLAADGPDLVAELVRLFRLAGTTVDRGALKPAIALAIRYSAEQGLLSREIGLRRGMGRLAVLAA